MEDGVEISNLSIPIAKGEKGDAGKITSLAITMLASDATPTVVNNGTVYDGQYVLGIPRGVSVSSTEINDDGELIITLEDNTEFNVGVVVGSSISSVYIDENYDLIVELTDETSITAGNLETMLQFILDDYYTKTEVDSTFALIDETGNKIEVDVNSSTYVVTVTLKDKNGETLSSDTIDLPLESVVVSGAYDNTTKKVILTLQGGSTVEFSVADLVAGLQSEITNANKLSADLVDDTSATNKFVTSAEKTNIAQIPNSLMIKKLTENLAITDGNVPSLAEGYYYTGSYHVSVNGSNVVDLDDAIFYFSKTATDFDFELIKIWGSGLGFPYVVIDKFTDDDEINIIKRAPLTSNQLVTSISSSSRDNQIPSAKCVYDLIGDLETILTTLDVGSGV